MSTHIIALIRCARDATNGSNDDSITILGNTYDPGLFRVKHTVPSSESVYNKKISTSNLMNNEALHLYLHALFTLLKNDAEPFKHIQLDITGIPTVIVRPERLDYVEGAVMNYVNMVSGLDNEYKAPIFKPVLKSTTSHLFFDEDGFEC